MTKEFNKIHIVFVICFLGILGKPNQYHLFALRVQLVTRMFKRIKLARKFLERIQLVGGRVWGNQQLWMWFIALIDSRGFVRRIGLQPSSSPTHQYEYHHPYQPYGYQSTPNSNPGSGPSAQFRRVRLICCGSRACRCRYARAATGGRW